MDPKNKDRKPGDTPPPGKLACFNSKGQYAGHVGPRATSATVARLTGQHGAKLTKVNGQPAWKNDTLAEASAAGTNPNAIQPPPPKPPSMIQNLNAAKGSAK
jgi:hypothetical protein